MTWFEQLTGFQEESAQQVRSQITIDGNTLICRSNGQRFTWGALTTPSLGELRQQVRNISQVAGKLSVREVLGDVRQLYEDPANAGALFQVASQFNLLEMISPQVTPEQGITIYARDRTQGPISAIACGAGTIYRNYFAEVNGEMGQTALNQINCLEALGQALGNQNSQLWTMKNGYALPSQAGLETINQQLQGQTEPERDHLRALLRIGVQWQTQVTLPHCQHLVTQAYCSALPVAYCDYPGDLWQNFATLVLEAAYEATLCAAILNHHQTGNNKLFLTLLGGGAFGNEPPWIIHAIQRALEMYQNHNLNVFFVSYRRSNPLVQKLIANYS